MTLLLTRRFGRVEQLPGKSSWIKPRVLTNVRSCTKSLCGVFTRCKTTSNQITHSWRRIEIRSRLVNSFVSPQVYTMLTRAVHGRDNEDETPPRTMSSPDGHERQGSHEGRTRGSESSRCKISTTLGSTSARETGTAAAGCGWVGASDIFHAIIFPVFMAGIHHHLSFLLT